MWEAIAKVVIAGMNSGLAGILVIILIAWMVDRYLLVRDLKDLNQQMIDAFKESSATNAELSTLIGQLCSRI